jgi:GT2 family glycosyltransferase
MRVAEQQTIAAGLSLIIASLNEGNELHETLRSVLAGSAVPSEIIVVDDGGTDGSCAALVREDWQARGVRMHRIERQGIAAARNFGGRLATGARVAFMDAHCRLDRNCIAAMQSALDVWPDAIIAPSMCDYHTDVYGCGVRLIDPELRVRWLPPPVPDGTAKRLPIAPGGCLALSRTTFDLLGGFGVFRELGQEDIEFGLRAWRAGVDVLAAPLAMLAHKFRPMLPYSLAATSRAFNVAKIALVHFEGVRREECLRKIIGTPRASEVLVEAFSSDWEAERDAIAAVSRRTIESFFQNFGDWR